MFSYEGGKARLRNWIGSFTPLSGHRYVEAFAGRGAVFWFVALERRYHLHWINDIQTAPFFHALLQVRDQDIPKQVPKINQPEWKLRYEERDPAALVLEPKLHWGGGRFETGSFVGTDTVGGEDRWKRDSFLKSIRKARQLLLRVRPRITDWDYKKVLEQCDQKDFVYVDPPYIGAKVRSYNESMFKASELVRILSKAKFKWILSEYDNEIYRTAFGPPQQHFQARMSLAHTGGSTRIRGECLWGNFKMEWNPPKPKSDAMIIAPILALLRTRQRWTPGEIEVELRRMGYRDSTIQAQMQRVRAAPGIRWDGVAYHREEFSVLPVDGLMKE